MVVCRVRRNKEYNSGMSQKAAEPKLAPEKRGILQNGATSSESPSDWENLVDFYLAGESGEKLLSEMAESSENLQVCCPIRLCLFYVQGIETNLDDGS